MSARNQTNRRPVPDIGAALAVLTVYCALVASLVFTVLARDIVPDNFLGDGYVIQRLAQHDAAFHASISYVRTAEIYRFLHLQDSAALAGLFGYLSMVLVTLLALRGRLLALRDVPTTLVTVACLGLGAVYLGWYNKDFVVLALTLPVILQLQRRAPERAWWWTLAPMAAYACLFRPYWIAVAVLFAAFYLFVTLRPTEDFWPMMLQLAKVSVATLLAISFIYPLFAGEPITTFREAANAYRLDHPGAASAITPWFTGTGPFSTFLNVSLTLTGLALPWPLLLTGQISHMIYSAFIGSMWLSSARLLARRYSSMPASARTAIRMGVSLLTALMTVQSLFEPDYGSYLRHLTPLLPVLLLTLLIARQPAAVKSHPATPPPRQAALPRGVPDRHTDSIRPEPQPPIPTTPAIP